MSKKIVRMSALLFVVCAVVAGVLGGVNELTAARIQRQQQLATEAAYRKVLPAEHYEPLAYTGSVAGVTALSSCPDGHVVTMNFYGSQGEMSMVVGVDAQLRCTGISVIAHKETSGLGAEAASRSKAGESWRAQFVGQGADVAVAKDGGSVDAISGATNTSRAVAAAVGDAIRAVAEIQ